MDVSLFSLKVFLKVAESKSFTKAAQSLLLSQPAVSLQIKKIEQLFQTPLFIRSHSGGVRLTVAGEKLRRHAEKLIHCQQQMVTDMASESSDVQHGLHIGACCIAGEYLITSGFDSFREAHPNTSLSVSIVRCEKVFSSLLEGVFDLGVTGVAPRTRSLEKKLLVRVPIVFFEAQTGQGECNPAPLGLLKNRSLILRERGSGSRVEVENFLVKHGVSLRALKVETESESNEAIKTLVKAGHGISALPDFMVREEIDKGVFAEITLLEGQPMESFYVVYRKEESPPVPLKDLITFILRHPPSASPTVMP